MGKATKAEIMKDEGKKLILADGNEHEIKFDLNSLCALQEKFGDKIIEELSGMDTMDFKKIRTILHATLEHEGLTEKEAGSLINMKNINSVVEVLSEAMNNAMPETEETQTESGK
ncbi:hypothetical protein [Viridibacillus arvi]|uniref:hypothetical protein n=1 Tax=Viridibacillus arvi TaxID=263475 RepID=UPI0034CDA75D